MVTQQEKEMLWECFGEGSGVEIREVAQTRGLSQETTGIVHPESECQLISRSCDLPTLTKASITEE